MSMSSASRSTTRAITSRSASLGSGLAARSRGAKDVGLRLVGPVRVRARRAPFVVVMLSILAAGLIGLILLSTAMQAQAFKINELQRESALLQAHQDQLIGEVSQLASPAGLADRALNEGMVPNANPVFLRLADGAVIGQPVPAEPGTNVRRAE